jgi:hypothetical protein
MGIVANVSEILKGDSREKITPLLASGGRYIKNSCLELCLYNCEGSSLMKRGWRGQIKGQEESSLEMSCPVNALWNLHTSIHLR